MQEPAAITELASPLLKAKAGLGGISGSKGARSVSGSVSANTVGL